MKNTVELKTYGDVAMYLSKKCIPASMLNDIFRAAVIHSVPMTDATSKGQLASKIWLSETVRHLLHQRFNNVLLCGGWYGTLIPIFNHYNQSDGYTSIDIDPSCKAVFDTVVSSVRETKEVVSKTADMYGYDYVDHDLIINTSTEHISDIKKWLSNLPSGKTVLMQNNNMYGYEGHVNCKSSIEEFLHEVEPVLRVLYHGSLVLPDYTRFMICGIVK